MQDYDVLMAGILVVTVLWGAWKGLAWQLASLASLVLSYGAALRFSGHFAPLFGDEAPWNRFAAMLALYVVASAGVWLVFHLVRGVLDNWRLRGFDRQMGAMVGGVKGLAICLVITFFAVTLSDSTRQRVLASRSGVYIAQIIRRADPILPSEVRQVLDPYLDRLNDELAPLADAEEAPDEADRWTAAEEDRRAWDQPERWSR